MSTKVEIDQVLEDVETELLSATSKHGLFHSDHEGYAILKEEVDELWDEVKKRERSREKMRAEAIQVAAMAVQFALRCSAPPQRAATQWQPCEEVEGYEFRINADGHLETRRKVWTPSESLEKEKPLRRVYQIS